MSQDQQLARAEPLRLAIARTKQATACGIVIPKGPYRAEGITFAVCCRTEVRTK
jgi:hypothetical protein